ncbi:NUDIX domain-containing protein [Sporocytophaga myxococcoides]|uniref:NUDIX domain-containing protein n=1 Tax=Sporocytophaga myxococcoides TaxID=153721 RepID=UPI0005EFC1D9|nr:NUDIX domain-containing protein [Sporocytophaga myxococcoides]
MKISAGLLMYVFQPELRLLLAHPGGPFFKNKDEGSWTIPKGEVGTEEEIMSAAKREFIEETGILVKDPLIDLSFVRQKSGKKVYCWAFEGEEKSIENFTSNSFEMEWPRRSGKKAVFVEIDRIELFTPAEARKKILVAQISFIDRLKDYLNKEL